VLCADDYGRGLAHTGWLARKFNKAVALVEEALTQLEACHLLGCYQVEQQRYYVLLRWAEWETLSRPTPSKYPDPPWQAEHEGASTQNQDSPGCSHNPPNFPGDFGNTLTEGEEEEEQEEEEEKEDEDEGEEEAPVRRVVPFPIGANAAAASLSQSQLSQMTKQVARILNLQSSDALRRVVQEYSSHPALSLLGEADSAREWIDDPKRNCKRQRMTPAFFRRWLKREVEAVHQRQRAPNQATGTTGMSTPGLGMAPPAQTGREGHATRAAPAPSSAPADPYQDFVARRASEVHTHGAATPEQQEQSPCND
jgi:hypothetical protein